jgi:ABC-type phosphate transport system permease subunit
LCITFISNKKYTNGYHSTEVSYEDDTITTIGKNDKGDNMMEYYVSIYMPLAMALFILLPLLGVGMCWLYRRLRDKKRNNQGANV